MTSTSYPLNEVVSPTSIMGTKSMHAHSLTFPDHQSVSYPHSAAYQPDSMTTTSCSSENVSAATVTHVPNSNGWAAKEDWARHQALIKQLYLSEKKPLSEVMRLMESKHGFRATIKMYKSHIKQWGLDKKNKEFEMRAIVRKNKQRADQGKRSVIRVRGQVRHFADIVRYWDRKGVSIDDIIARNTASPTPEAVECFTPVPSPIRMPQVLAIPERMFLCIRDYATGSFESGTWVRTAPLLHCYSIKRKFSDELKTFTMQFHLACSLFLRNLYQEAGQTLLAGFARIRNLIIAEEPDSLVELLYLIVLFHKVKRGEIALMILRQFSALGRLLLASEHPLCRICDWMDRMYTSDFHDVVIKCIESIADQFEKFVGPMHQSTLHCRQKIFQVRSWLGYESIRMLENLHDECEKTIGPRDIRTFHIRRYLANKYFQGSYYVEAMNLSRKSIAYSHHLQSINSELEEHNEGLYMVAKCQYALGEVDLGIANLERAVDRYVSAWGPQHGRVRKWLLRLEDRYLEQGDWASAAQVRDRWKKAQEPVVLL